MNKATALDNFKIFIEVFNKLNIHYWLTDGTLLGYYREKDFIQHDTDIDFGMFIDDHNPQIVHELKKRGFTQKTYGTIERGLEYTFYRGGMGVDIFFFYKEGDTCWHAAWDGKMIKFIYPKLTFKKAVFKGIEVTVPENELDYIIRKYGPEWNTPDKSWHWATSPKNIG